MSDISDKALFKAPSLYSSSVFKLVQHTLRPSNNAPNHSYYGQGDSLVFDFTGSANEMILASTAMFSGVYKVFPDDNLPDSGRITAVTGAPVVGDPYATADILPQNYFSSRSATGLPRVDFGCPFFESFSAKVNGSRVTQYDTNADDCRTYWNGVLACSPFGASVDLYSVGRENNQNYVGPHDITKHNGNGPLKLCNFRSDFERLQSFSGCYRFAQDSYTVATTAPTLTLEGKIGLKGVNGGLICRYPMSLFTGLFSSENSAFVPVGLLGQQSSSAIQCRFQLARGDSVVVAGSRGESLILNDGTFTPGVLDGVGATVNQANPWGLFSPTITYRSLLILDDQLMNSLQALYMGQGTEMVSFGGQDIPIYRSLYLKYPSHSIHSYVHTQGTSTSFYDIPTTAVSLRGVMVRFVKTTYAVGESKAPDWVSADGKSLVVKSLVFKVGSNTYPLEAISNQNIGSLSSYTPAGVTPIPVVGPAPVTNASANNRLVAQQNLLDSESLMNSYSLEGKAIFSPFKELTLASVFEDAGDKDLQIGTDNFQTKAPRRRTIAPFTMSFENSASSLDVHELTEDRLYGVRGLNMQGISNLRMECSLGVATDKDFVPPSADVRVVIALVWDSVMSIQRGSIDVEHEKTLFG